MFCVKMQTFFFLSFCPFFCMYICLSDNIRQTNEFTNIFSFSYLSITFVLWTFCPFFLDFSYFVIGLPELIVVKIQYIFFFEFSSYINVLPGLPELHVLGLPYFHHQLTDYQNYRQFKFCIFFLKQLLEFHDQYFAVYFFLGS